MSDEIEISDSIQRIVWKRLGNKSVRQIAQETGLTPEQVLRIKNELLDGVDDLTLVQKKQKLLVDLEELAQEARDLVPESAQDFKAGLINASVSAMKTVLAELNRMEKADNSKVEALNSLRMREILRFIDTTVALTLDEVSDTYDVPRADLDRIFQSHLLPAAQELESM